MAPPATGESSRVATDAADTHTAEAFALLGNETRLGVLLALWEEYDPDEDDNDVPFSRILERVDIDDPGNLSYHIEKLEGQFVSQRGEREGYELRESGLTVVRAIIAGAGIQEVTLDAAPIDEQCPFCEAPTAISYREGVVIHACTDCDGADAGGTETDGLLSAVPFDPAGLTGRSPAEIRALSMVAAMRQVRSLFDGLCPACSGPVDSRLECCPDHDPDGTCEQCGTKFAAWARFRCRTCKNHSVSSPKELVLFHPAAVSFYDDHGIAARPHADNTAAVERLFELVDDHDIALLETDPPAVTVTASLEGDEIGLTFDETASVVDVSR